MAFLLEPPLAFAEQLMMPTDVPGLGKL